jgi:hypothetical protein
MGGLSIAVRSETFRINGLGRRLNRIELGEVFLGVTVRAEKDALFDFPLDSGPAAIGKHAEIEFEGLLLRIQMVPAQGSRIARVPTPRASASRFHEQLMLAVDSPQLLCRIILMSVVGLGVLAFPRAKLSLPARECPGALSTRSHMN